MSNEAGETWGELMVDYGWPLELDNEDYWVDGSQEAREWAELSTDHLRTIIRGFRAGNSYAGQKDKLKRAKLELAQRLTSALGGHSEN